MKHIKSNIGQKLYFDRHISVFKVNQGNLTEDVWKLGPEEFYGLLDKIDKNSIRLKEISKIDRGIYTGLNEAFVVDETIIQSANLERKLLKPLVAGKNVKRFSINYKGLYLIYTKDIDIEEYPNTKKYLERFIPKLEKRWCVTDPRMGRKWYELEKPREPELYETEKIITPDISIRNNFTYDGRNHYCLDTAFVIAPKEKYKDKILFILGLLNSLLIEFYFKQISTHVRGGYFRYKKQYLERLPIKLPPIKKEQKLADEITSLVEEILALAKVEQRIQNFPEPYFEEFKDEIEEYDIVKWIPKRSYKELKPVLEPEITGGSRIILGRDDFIQSTKIDSEVKEKYIIDSLRGGKARKDAEFRIRFPLSDAMVKKILRRYEKDKERLKEKPIAELEEEMNERVYRLYGLDEEDKRVIEEFLEKF
jgi:hypothetical protein